MMAELLVSQLVDQQLIVPRAGRESDRDARYEAHLSGLDDAYFLEGQGRLDGLRKWAAARVTRQRELP